MMKYVLILTVYLLFSNVANANIIPKLIVKRSPDDTFKSISKDIEHSVNQLNPIIQSIGKVASSGHHKRPFENSASNSINGLLPSQRLKKSSKSAFDDYSQEAVIHKLPSMCFEDAIKYTMRGIDESVILKKFMGKDYYNALEYIFRDFNHSSSIISDTRRLVNFEAFLSNAFVIFHLEKIEYSEYNRVITPILNDIFSLGKLEYLQALYKSQLIFSMFIERDWFDYSAVKIAAELGYQELISWLLDHIHGKSFLKTVNSVIMGLVDGNNANLFDSIIIFKVIAQISPKMLSTILLQNLNFAIFKNRVDSIAQILDKLPECCSECIDIILVSILSMDDTALALESLNVIFWTRVWNPTTTNTILALMAKSNDQYLYRLGQEFLNPRLVFSDVSLTQDPLSEAISNAAFMSLLNFNIRNILVKIKNILQDIKANQEYYSRIFNYESLENGIPVKSENASRIEVFGMPFYEV